MVLSAAERAMNFGVPLKHIRQSSSSSEALNTHRAVCELPFSLFSFSFNFKTGVVVEVY